MNRVANAEKESDAAADYLEELKTKKQQSEVEQQPEPEPVPVSSPHAPSQHQDDESIGETLALIKQLPHHETATPPSKTTTIDSTESVRSLKDPKLIKGRRRPESPSNGPTTTYITPTKKKSSSSPITPETHKITICTISPASSFNNSAINESPSIRKAYADRQRSRQATGKKTSCGELHDILEEFQLCGMYFCREFLATYNDTPDDVDVPKTTECNESTTAAQIVTKRSREERMREMDDMFLGKMIQCESGDGDDYALFRSDEGRDECCRELKY